jgi:hypothetical protein
MTTPREQMVEVLSEHTIECTGPGEVTCRACRDKGWMTWGEYRVHLVDALAAKGLVPEIEEWGFRVSGTYLEQTRDEAGARRLASPGTGWPIVHRLTTPWTTVEDSDGK